MTPRTLSFRGCTTSTQAMALLRGWLEDIHADQMREFESDVLACECGDDVDVDELDMLLDAERIVLARYRDVLLQGAHALCVAHGLA